jgi:hypothetical protein
MGTIHRERIKFLSQTTDKLANIRGRELYENLAELGLTHGQFFRALGTSMQDYCSQEFGIDINRTTVEQFFQSDRNAKWLFPYIVRESVLAGLRRRAIYPSLIVCDEYVDDTVYKMPYVAEYSERVVHLAKVDHSMIASYKEVRCMSLDILRVHLQRLGERLGRSLDARLASVLVGGDKPGSESAPVVINTATAGTWAYSDITAGIFRLALNHYFTPTHMLADPALCKTILQMDEFRDAALLDFAKTGNLLSMKLVVTDSQPANTLTILDAGYAVQKLTEQDVVVENDKLIHRQWDYIYVMAVTDFAVLYSKARVVVRSDWS